MAAPALPVNTTVKYKWTIKLFNHDGSTPVTADYTGYSVSETTNEILHASNRQMNFYLNGVDDCSFTIYLDDPMAEKIQPLKTVVKVWRTVYEEDGETIIFDDATGPGWASFAGLVTSTTKDGDQNTMTVQCYSALWRLQTRFHVHNHYLVNDPETGDKYTGTGIIFHVIELLNDAFPATGDAYTGIEIGNRGWVDEPHMAPYFIAEGTNSWSVIFDDVMSRPAAADIIPNYNDDGTNIICILDTDEKRGDDISGFIGFNFHIGDGTDNCDNLTEEIVANPGEFANYLWAVGQGGPNSGKKALAWDNASGDYDSNSIGLYMKVTDHQEIKRVTSLTPIAEAELAQSRWPKFAYTITSNPYGGLIYKYNYDVGDVVNLSATKGALQVNKNQRIYQIGLAMSDNNVEIASPLVSNDFYGKVAGDGSSGGGSGPIITPTELTAAFTVAE